MVAGRTTGRTVFQVANYSLLTLLFFLCFLPFVHVLAVSLSARVPAVANEVAFWPIGANIESYRRMFEAPDFLNSLFMSVKRVALGVPINFVLTVLVAYPLSKEAGRFRFRTVYAWLFVITMLINGGLIPWYLTIRLFGLIDTVWALVLPSAVPVFSVMIMLNYFRGLPKELEESALMDGASHWIILWRIYIPVSIPCLATVVLFSFVFHWNSWFDGLLLMNSTAKFPLQSLLQTFIVGSSTKFFSMADLLRLKHASEASMKSALIVMGCVPVFMVFPFLQRFLMTGLVLGSVKQ